METQLAVDIVNPPPKTIKEAIERHQNNTASVLRTRPMAHRTIIAIKYVPSISCSGYGRRHCEVQGEHSWFNHSMDNFYANNESNLPEEYKDV